MSNNAINAALRRMGYTTEQMTAHGFRAIARTLLRENDILIRFDSPIVYALNEYEKRPCWGMTDAIPGFSHLRKAHSMFGWDWGARLPDAGIWRPISLLGITGAQIQSVRIEQQHDENGVLLRFFPEIETLSAAQPAVRGNNTGRVGTVLCLSPI